MDRLALIGATAVLLLDSGLAGACSPRAHFHALDDLDQYAYVVRGLVDSASIYRDPDGQSWIHVTLAEPIHVRGKDRRSFRTSFRGSSCDQPVVVGEVVWVLADQQGEFEGGDMGAPLSPVFYTLELSVPAEVRAQKQHGDWELPLRAAPLVEPD